MGSKSNKISFETKEKNSVKLVNAAKEGDTVSPICVKVHKTLVLVGLNFSLSLSSLTSFYLWYFDLRHTDLRFVFMKTSSQMGYHNGNFDWIYINYISIRNKSQIWHFGRQLKPRPIILPQASKSLFNIVLFFPFFSFCKYCFFHFLRALKSCFRYR